MAEYTIYSEGIWERMLEKYSQLKKAASRCNALDDPERAKEISKKYNHNFGIGTLSNEERKLAELLLSVNFVESSFLKQLAITGNFHYANGAGDYSMASMELVLADFENSFRDWLREMEKKTPEEQQSFQKMYECFLDVIKLKLEYKIPYTKLFIKKLLETSKMPKEDALEIKQYFIEKDMLPKIEKELEPFMD